MGGIEDLFLQEDVGTDLLDEAVGGFCPAFGGGSIESDEEGGFA